MENINEPQILEEMYQSNKETFTESIKSLHEEETNVIIKYWYARLFYKTANKKTNTFKYITTAILIILAWIPIRLMLDGYVGSAYLHVAIPIIFSISLSLFFLLDSINIKNILIILLLHAAVYICLVLLMDNIWLNSSYRAQTVRNACLFMLILLWFFILFAKSGCNIKSLDYNGFIEKTGDVIVCSTIFIAGGIVIVGVSLALFNTIGIDAWDFYLKNIVTLGLLASPFVSLLVIENSKRVKLSVNVANIFLPFILISLIFFEIMLVGNSKDRDIYNIVTAFIICVLVFTSINNIKSRFISFCFNILSVFTILFSLITLYAVIYRLNHYGISPNRITLLGTNIIMLGHLVYIVYLKAKNRVEQNTLYLPVYFIWAFVVVFIMSFLFQWYFA